MNINILKDSLNVLFDTKQKQIIALLLVVIAGFVINMAISDNNEVVQDEIQVVEKEIEVVEKASIVKMKDIERNKEQIDALWIYIRRVEKEHKQDLGNHSGKRKH